MPRVMRVCALIAVLALTAGYKACGRLQTDAAAPALAGVSAPAATRVDFDKQVRPLLEPRCTPCHFAGGTMYQRLPFDRPETIRTLGTKLFTRIKDEEERRLISDFLTQQAEESHDQP
jgi:hypothetical protein